MLISDSLRLFVKPVAYETFQVKENVRVSIGIQDIMQGSTFIPTAKAAFIVQVVNSADSYERFQLNFWYHDQTGRRAYESSMEVEVGPFETRQTTVDISFESAGTFEVVAEARSVPEGQLLNVMQLTATIPWLLINFYLLLLTAIAIVGVSGAAIALYLVKRGVRITTILTPVRSLAGLLRRGARTIPLYLLRRKAE